MTKNLFFLFAAILLFSLPDTGFGQMDRKQIQKNNRHIMTYRGKKHGFPKEKRYFAMGLSVNALNYYGDLAPNPGRFSTDLSFTRPAIGISALQRLGPRFSMSAAFMYGTLKGSDFSSADEQDAKNGKYRYYRNLSFRNRIAEFSLMASFDLFENQATYLSRSAWTPYVYGGISVFHHNPQALAPANDLNGTALAEAGQWVNLRELGTEGQYAELLPTDANYGIKPYKLMQAAIPMGLGVRFKLNEVVDFSAEIGFRYLFTDYIDDVSGNYVDLGVLDSELARALSYRSNEITGADVARTPTLARNGETYDLINGYGTEYPSNIRGKKNNNDIFMVTSLRVSYILGKSMHRAKFR
ncbi:MAG TPA: DUF6089 family protein [Chryseosolibacter sp.]|nr:DUF6089 family protein [Chryseosolibacter sp.]